MERKFKVGDRVKNIRNISGFESYNISIGLVGTINEIDDSNLLPYNIKFENGQHGWLEDDELELVKEEKPSIKEDIRSFDDLKIMLGDKFEQTLYQSNIDCLKLIADLEKENKILKSNVLNNDKVVNKVNDKDRAEKGQTYWFLYTSGSIACSVDFYDNSDNYRYKMGNYYLNKEECKRAKEIQDILIKYSYNFTKEELEDCDTNLHYISANPNGKRLSADSFISFMESPRLFEAEEDCQHAIDEIGYSDYIKYCVIGGIK